MSKFKVGDKVLTSDGKVGEISAPPISSTDVYYQVETQEKYAKFYMLYSESDLILCNTQIKLEPDKEWNPENITLPVQKKVKNMEKTLKPEDCQFHEWVDVVLFSHTVTECKKCGKLKE